jgi:hypothetical protein
MLDWATIIIEWEMSMKIISSERVILADLNQLQTYPEPSTKWVNQLLFKVK